MMREISMEEVAVASRDQVSADLGGEAAILHLKNGVYYSLDPVGARIWELLQQPRRVGQILASLTEEFDVEAERCKRDLIELLAKLEGEGLIQIRLEAPAGT
jgi:Coenzyme PQQ synthesis protein D (PqqD)